jgi:SMODS-associating 2TM, beta-strand rich effector domain
MPFGRPISVHPYSTDESRISVYSGLAVLAVVLAWLIMSVTSRLSWPQWLIGPPSLAATFGLVYQVFDRVGWRLASLHKLGVVGVAEVAGIYRGKLVSTFTDHDGRHVERDVTLRIMQTWTKLSVEMTLTSGTSSSVSTSALGSLMSDGGAARLTYVYRNRVNPGVADADMGDHDGAADLRIQPDGRVSGRYFNSRPRAGTIDGQREGTHTSEAAHSA